MAYATTDVLILLTNAAIAVGPRFWFHTSADALAAADTDGFITDGGSKGLRVGDWVYHLDSQSDGDMSLHQVITVSATAPGAVDLSDGVKVGETANSD